MNTYLFCFALFVNIFPLVAGGILSNQYGLPFGNFLKNYTNVNGNLSPDVVESYHEGDQFSWYEENLIQNGRSKFANPGLFNNEEFLNSITVVIKKINPKIQEEIDEAEKLRASYREAISDSQHQGNKQETSDLLERNTANNQKEERLDQLKMLLKGVRKEPEYNHVATLVAALFKVVIFHNNGGNTTEMDPDKFISFMNETPGEKESLPYLIQTAFKEYMLGLINRNSTNGITADDLEEFLRTHCAFEGDHSGNFDYFANEMNSKAENTVDVTKVRENWSKISVVSAFNTLVKPCATSNLA